VTTQLLCTPGFVDDAMFLYNDASGAELKMTLFFIDFAYSVSRLEVVGGNQTWL